MNHCVLSKHFNLYFPLSIPVLIHSPFLVLEMQDYSSSSFSSLATFPIEYNQFLMITEGNQNLFQARYSMYITSYLNLKCENEVYYITLVNNTSCGLALLVRRNSTLRRLMNSNTLPLDMNGIMSRGISPSMHTPMSDITLVCSKDNMVDTSFASIFKSFVENSAVKLNRATFNLQNLNILGF